MKLTKTVFAILCILIVGGFVFLWFNNPQKALEFDVKRASHKLKLIENQFKEFENQTSLIQRLASKQYKKDDLEQISKGNFDVYIFKDDRKIFWSTSNVQISNAVNQISEAPSLIELKNGYYIARKWAVDDFEVVLSHLVKTRFSIENKFLQNKFNPIYNLSSSLEVLKPEEGQYMFYFFDNPVFSTDFNLAYSQEVNELNLTVSYLLIFLILVLAVFIAMYFLNSRQFSKALVSVVLFSVVFNLIFPHLPLESFKTPLYSPALYGSLYFGQSLGYFLINVFWIGLLVFVLSKYLPALKFSTLWLVVFAVFQTLFFTYLMFGIRSAVLDSVISFKITTFAELNSYTLFGLLVIVMLSGGFFYLQVAFLKILAKFTKYQLPIILGQSLLIFSILILSGFGLLAYSVPLVLMLFNWLYVKYIARKPESSFFTAFLTLLIASSVVIALTINHFNLEKEKERRLKVASQLTNQRDLMAEFAFNEKVAEIKSDPFVKRHFTSPLSSNRDLVERINYLYLGGYLSKYENTIRAFGSEGKPIKSPETDSVGLFLDKTELHDDSLTLHILPDGSFEYLSVLKIFDDERLAGYLAFVFTPQKFLRDNIYPELLLEDKNKPIIEIDLDIFDYAIYNNSRLSAQSGSFYYPFDFDFPAKNESEIYTVKKGGYLHTIFVESKQKTIVVSSPVQSFLTPFSILSYVFFFTVFVFLLTTLILKILDYAITGQYKKSLKSSFRYTINFSILGIIFVSFIVVGIITVQYFSQEYENYHLETLNQKQRSILLNFESLVKQTYSYKDANDLFQNLLYTDLKSMAEINAIDINVYDLRGKLIAGSQPAIFTNGLISRSMNPYAYRDLSIDKKDRLVVNEKIGNMKFISAYSPIRNAQDEVIAYLNLPYFNKENNLRKEISDFIVAFINVYVLLLVLASLLGLIVSNSITASLAQIGEKLSAVNIGRKNEFLTWNADDEIGALVKEYNKMIVELEKGADVLAKSERESAWREMARQIAHEIKNPLTPMKLSIQHLQRAMKDDPQRGAELADKVSKNLIEQIDNLSHIATAFSSFAQMPKGDKEPLELLPVIQNVAQLFSTDSSLDIEVVSEVDNAVIFADKNQMISVFNNLIKNAVQAVEEVENPLVQVKLFKRETHFIVEVQDNGTGISDEMKHKVFVPNFTTKTSGTGLGLAISKQIVENSGGRIWFESEQGKGSVFYVKLPVYQG